jgi:hypothetical protein
MLLQVSDQALGIDTILKNELSTHEWVQGTARTWTHHLVIDTPLLQQALMCALLQLTAVAEHEDNISVLHRR